MTTQGKHPPYDLPKCLDCHRAGQKSCIPIDRAWPGVRCDRCVTNGLPCSEPVYSRASNAQHRELTSQGSGGLSRGGVKRGSSSTTSAKPAAAPMPFSQQVHDDDDDWRPSSQNNPALKPRGDAGYSSPGRQPVVQFQPQHGNGNHHPHKNLSMDDISISDDSRAGVNEESSGNEHRGHRDGHKRREKRKHKKRGSSVDDFRMSGQSSNRDSWGQNPRGSYQGTPGGSQGTTPTQRPPQNVTFDTTPTQGSPQQTITRGSGSKRAREMQAEMQAQQARQAQPTARASQDVSRPAPVDTSPDKSSRRVSAPPSSYKDPEDHGHPDHADNNPSQSTPPTSTGKSGLRARLLPWMNKSSHSSPETTPSKDQKHIHHHDPNNPRPQQSQPQPNSPNITQALPSLGPPQNIASEQSSLRSQPLTQPQQPAQPPQVTRRSSQVQASPVMQPLNSNPHNPRNASQQVVQPMSSQGSMFNGQIPAGMAPIHFATVTGDVNMLYTLLQLGADIHATTAAGLTCLHLAVAHRLPSIVQALLDRHADPNRRAPDGMTPLLLAISPQGGSGIGDMEARKTVIRLLGSRGADPNVREPGTGRTALHVAVEGREAGIVEALLGLRPDVDATDGKGMSALHEAVTRGDVEMVKVLAAAGGANLNALVGRPGQVPQGQMGQGHQEEVTDDEMF